MTNVFILDEYLITYSVLKIVFMWIAMLWFVISWVETFSEGVCIFIFCTITTFLYQNIETFMETQRRNLSLLLEKGFYFVSKGPVISKKFIGFKNLMSWSGANQSKAKRNKKIANYNFFNQQQTSIKNWSCCYIHKKV